MEDHPRIRGTNAYLKKDLLIAAGSPPHTRDKLLRSVGIFCSIRITPAYAGQMLQKVCFVLVSQDHPRIRGTNLEHRTLSQHDRGSPPHTRDKYTKHSSYIFRYRITPAYAGQIAFSQVWFPLFEDHPRIRGTNS